MSFKNTSKTKLILIFTSILISFCSKLSADSFLSGNVGGELEFSGKETSSKYDPDLKLKAFFEGQFNFTNNIWGHMSLSLNTEDFIASEFFHPTDAEFALGELSAVFRSVFPNFSNYFGIYVGTFDPMGSDIFLQRYLGSKPIASKLTESWLGKENALIYPHNGIGISDVIKFNAQPLALGSYLYLRKDEAPAPEDFYLNTDLRLAGVYRYCSFDAAVGLGYPHSGSSGGSLLSIDKVYLHGGATVLIGNNYTQSLLLQAGLHQLTIETNQPVAFDIKDIYLLVEPRFLFDYIHLNTSVYYIPKDSVANLKYIYETLGANINIYSNSIAIGDKVCTLGFMASAAFKDKTLGDLVTAPIETLKTVDAYTTPYFQTTFLTGTLSAQLDLNVTGFFKTGKPWYENIIFDAGYVINF